MNQPGMKNTNLKPLGKNAPPKKILKQVQKLHGLGKHRECLELCERLANKGIVQPDFLHLHGLALRACGEFAPALTKINAAHERDPQNAAYINSMGMVFLDLNDTETAIELFKRATQLDQKFFTAWNNLGIALRTAERYNAAELAFTCAYHLDPSNSEPLLNLVDILVEVRAYDRAEEFMNRFLSGGMEETPQIKLKRLHVAARLQDLSLIEQRYKAIDKAQLNVNEQAQVDNIWAYFLGMHERVEEAIAVLEPWQAKDNPHQAHMQSQLGLLYAQAGKLQQAIDCHKQMLGRNPDHVAGRYNLAMLQFQKGEIAEGNSNYEARWQWKEFPTKRRVFDMPQWKGEPLAGKKILVWREQGIGDEIRFNSLLPELMELDASITLEASPKLIPLFRNSFKGIDIREEGPLECRGDEAYQDFEYHIPSGSLAGIFRNDLQSFAERQTPWLQRDHGMETAVRQTLGVSRDTLLVGLCWRSSNAAVSRNKYFFDIEQLAPLTSLQNVEWLNVQYDAMAGEIKQARELGLGIHHVKNINQKDDLVSACGLLGACDLIITIGGAVGDLSGGLGVPTVYITRAHSEVFLGTDHAPWFPSVKTFPMEANAGDAIISDIIGRWPELAAWAKEFADPALPEDLTATNTAGNFDHVFNPAPLAQSA